MWCQVEPVLDKAFPALDYRAHLPAALGFASPLTHFIDSFVRACTLGIAVTAKKLTGCDRRQVSITRIIRLPRCASLKRHGARTVSRSARQLRRINARLTDSRLQRGALCPPPACSASAFASLSLRPCRALAHPPLHALLAPRRHRLRDAVDLLFVALRGAALAEAPPRRPRSTQNASLLPQTGQSSVVSDAFAPDSIAANSPVSTGWLVPLEIR